MFEIESNTFVNCGQVFHIVSREILNEMRITKQFNGVVLSDTAINQIDKQVSFSEKYSEFKCCVTIMCIGETRKVWLPVLFFQSQFGMVRVGIESVKCDCCKWEGYVANPTLPFLFDTISNRFEEMKKAALYPSVSCPQCGLPLNRAAIWADK